MDLPAPFHVGVSRMGRRVVFAPEGELDIATAETLRQAMRRDAPGAEVVVLDLRGLGFMDTAGLQLVLEQQRRSEEDGSSFALVRGSEQVHRLLDIAGLTPMLRILGGPEDPIDEAPSPA
jgi:response regulator NasT